MNKKNKRRRGYKSEKKKQYGIRGSVHNTIEGIYRQHADGVFGFIDVTNESGEKKGYYVHGSKKRNAFDGDTVFAKVKIYRGREEAEVLKILTRAKKVLVGKLVYGKTKEYAFVRSSNPTFITDVYIEQQYFGGSKEGDMVGVEIINRKKKTPEGKVIYILGKEGEDTEIETIILESGRPMKFPSEVLSEVNELSMPNIENEVKNRKDLRSLFTFTIDGADSKDLDDAISIELRNDNGYILYVHIADVAHFVNTGTALGKDAYQRGTSVYLADRVIPMLPPQLSNDLCSLHPETDKLTITAEISLDMQGRVEKVDIYESIINSDVRLTYKEVDEILGFKDAQEMKSSLKKDDKKTETLLFGSLMTQNLKNTLMIAWELKGKLWKRRKKRGSLDFNFSETKIILDKNGEVLGIEKYPSYESNKLIEVFMVLANESVGKKFRNIPFLYRVHEKPKKEDIATLKNVLEVFHIPFEIEEGSTKEFAALLKLIREEWTDDAVFLQKMILRTLSKAMYSPKNGGHFGLGLRYYSHFTSPIRRYPDLQIHRIIKNVLKENPEYDITEKKLKKVGEHTTAREIKSQELERKVRDYCIAKFYEHKVGEEFEGMISGMIPKGIFIELKNTAEGMIVMGKKGIFDESLLERRNARGKETLRMGENVRVKLINVDMAFFKLEFKLLE